MLLVASYIFYGWWDWRFLSLIFISTVIDYFCGIRIDEAVDIKKKKLFVFISAFCNLTILGLFKYFNFFADNLQIILTQFGFQADFRFTNIILPVGISFYTFQTMSYSIDIFRGELKSTRKFLDFALFVSFFPQLVAGPIERAKRLLPQILSSRKITSEKLYNGSYLIFFGLFQKVFIADNLSKIVDPVFTSKAPYNGLSVLLAIYAFTFQIFCDFAGYSNIARGLGKLMGFDVMVNFNCPYLSSNPSEFWRRWHISLSTWLRDYVYIPLGGNRVGRFNTYRNLFLTMLIGGLWHGAAWIFIIWGVYHAFLLIIHRLLQPLLERSYLIKNNILRKGWHCVKIIFFFQFICLGWLIFRAQSIEQLYQMSHCLLFDMHISNQNIDTIFYIIFFISILLVIQISQYIKQDVLSIRIFSANIQLILILAIIYSFLLVMILGENACVGGGSEFIYFQF
jgi:D-alanyl-lipoteichoic acid acyltransferase DltB (MBOAT superfamily)